MKSFVEKDLGIKLIIYVETIFYDFRKLTDRLDTHTKEEGKLLLKYFPTQKIILSYCI